MIILERKTKHIDITLNIDLERKLFLIFFKINSGLKRKLFKNLSQSLMVKDFINYIRHHWVAFVKISFLDQMQYQHSLKCAIIFSVSVYYKTVKTTLFSHRNQI